MPKQIGRGRARRAQRCGTTTPRTPFLWCFEQQTRPSTSGGCEELGRWAVGLCRKCSQSHWSYTPTRASQVRPATAKALAPHLHGTAQQHSACRQTATHGPQPNTCSCPSPPPPQNETPPSTCTSTHTARPYGTRPCNIAFFFLTSRGPRHSGWYFFRVSGIAMGRDRMTAGWHRMATPWQRPVSGGFPMVL